MATPDNDEVGITVRVLDDNERRPRLRLGYEQVIGRQHHLLGVEAEGDGNGLKGIDRGTIDIGLAGLA
jgi:hypothetical protein